MIRLTSVRPWLAALLVGVALAACGGGGGGRDPILGFDGPALAPDTTLPTPAPDTTRPRISLTVPATTTPGPTTGVATNTAITAVFTEKMAPATISPASFTLTCAAPCVSPAGTVAYSISSQTAVFRPAAALAVNTTYLATITAAATDLAGNALAGNQAALPAASDYVWSFTTAAVAAVPALPPALALGSASLFGAFGGSAGVTSQGLNTVINGDVGTTAVSTAVTGFHDAGPGCTYTETPLNVGTVNGLIYTAAPPPTVACPSEGTATTFAIATQARADALAAYDALVAMPGGPDPGAGNLANKTLAPGVYTSSAGSFMIQGGDLTLDAQGDANAVWVFQMATSLTVGGPGAAFPSSIVLANGAQAKNVFWQVGSAATINAAGGGTMAGTIISQSGVAISTPGNVALVTINGRALSLGASVTMVNTVINVPAP
jgi:hypothetical protein